MFVTPKKLFLGRTIFLFIISQKKKSIISHITHYIDWENLLFFLNSFPTMRTFSCLSHDLDLSFDSDLSLHFPRLSSSLLLLHDKSLFLWIVYANIFPFWVISSLNMLSFTTLIGNTQLVVEYFNYTTKVLQLSGKCVNSCNSPNFEIHSNAKQWFFDLNFKFTSF